MAVGVLALALSVRLLACVLAAATAGTAAMPAAPVKITASKEDLTFTDFPSIRGAREEPASTGGLPIREAYLVD